MYFISFHLFCSISVHFRLLCFASPIRIVSTAALSTRTIKPLLDRREEERKRELRDSSECLSTQFRSPVPRCTDDGTTLGPRQSADRIEYVYFVVELWRSSEIDWERRHPIIKNIRYKSMAIIGSNEFSGIF